MPHSAYLMSFALSLVLASSVHAQSREGVDINKAQSFAPERTWKCEQLSGAVFDNAPSQGQISSLIVSQWLALGDKEKVEAARWYRLAADQGYPPAQNDLGLMYYHSEGVKQSYGEAFAWFMKAAQQGYADAQHNLGVAFRDGRGTAQDYEQAAEWFRKAADQGDTWSQSDLGSLYVRGNGVRRDYGEALKLFRRAAARGHSTAQFNLGVMYANGLGVERDCVWAYAWFRAAARNGYESVANVQDRLRKNMNSAQIRQGEHRLSAIPAVSEGE